MNPRLFDLAKSSLYIGVTGYGGPSILAHMKSIFVKKKAWISEKEFMDGLSLAQLLPGATGVTLMGYLGLRLKGILGAFILPTLFALPAFVFMSVLSWAYFQYGQLPIVKALFSGMGALVVALLVNALRTLGKSVYPSWSWKHLPSGLISLSAFISIFLLKINIVYVVLISALLGLFFFWKQMKALPSATSNPGRPREKKKGTEIGLAILGLLVISLIIFSPARDLFMTFIKIGALAFGGGFTSIPLMQAEIVDKLQLLTMTEFRDGIAMGQITPGPVLITATFVGFHVLGVFGAFAATLGIFLPSLIAILVLTSVHQIIKSDPITKSIVNGLLAGFIGLLLATTISFALHSLESIQTWSIFAMDLGILIVLKKDPLWAILASIILSVILL